MVIFEWSPFSEIIWVKNWALTNTIEVHHDIIKIKRCVFVKIMWICHLLWASGTSRSFTLPSHDYLRRRFVAFWFKLGLWMCSRPWTMYILCLDTVSKVRKKNLDARPRNEIEMSDDTWKLLDKLSWSRKSSEASKNIHISTFYSLII